MIIAIDFDGTIAFGKFPDIECPRAGAKKAITELYNAGNYIIIWTCRSGEDLVTAVNWLLSEGIPFHRINDNEPTQTALYSNNSRKVYAHCYIDDKNIFGFSGWENVVDWVNEKERLYNKNNQK